MKNIEYLVGSENTINQPLQPLNDNILEFCNVLSKNLMNSKSCRQYPDIAALAFWCRKANLQKLKENYSDLADRLGRGLCFHIAPGNIPINFAFSYLFGLLAGCSNIVRLSSKPFPQIEPICSIFKETLKDYPEIEKRTAFIKYQANDDITSSFSSYADARLIWGGDATIAKLKNMPSKPRCIDVCFSDRYSICFIDGKAITTSDDTTLKRLADSFYNDTYLMDQNACSSQQLIFWLNNNEEARNKFWSAVYSSAEKKYNLQPAISVDKYTHVFEDILNGNAIKTINKNTNLLYRVELSELNKDITNLRGKGGYFYEYDLNKLEELTPYITEKIQTATYFGVEAETIRQFITRNNLRGIDRIVPIGKAMDINIVWDGYDLITTLSRIITRE